MSDFMTVVKDHLKPLRSYINQRLYSKLKKIVDADDILQETLISAGRRYEKFLTSKIPFTIWLYKIAEDEVIEAYRVYVKAKKRSISRECSDENYIENEYGAFYSNLHEANIEQPLELAILSENTSILKQAFNRMNDQDKKILYMKHIDRLSNREIADLTGLCVHTVSMRGLRAFNRLRKSVIDNPEFMEMLCQK